MNVLSFADITRKSDILVVIVITNQLWKEEYLQYTENSGTLYKVYSLNIRFRADWQTTLIGNVTNKWWPSDNNLDIDTFHLNICCYCHCVKLKLVANQNNAITSNMMWRDWHNDFHIKCKSILILIFLKIFFQN